MARSRDHGRDGGSTAVRRGVLVLVAAGALAVTMAACGSDDKPVGSSQPATTVSTAAAAVTTTAAPKATVTTASSATFGTIMVDASGKTLYTFDPDTAGVSTCTGNCASTWPPLVLPSGVSAPVAGTGVSNLTVAARPDDAAKMQVNWDGKPLYTYAADTGPGDTKGDGVGGKWHVAKAS